MAQIPSFRSIVRAKFPTDLKWIGYLLGPLNSFMEDVTLAFNKRLNFTDNFDGEVKTFTAAGTYPINLAWGRTNRPRLGWVGNIQRTDGSDISYTTAVSPVWSYTQAGEIQISDMVGLDDSSSTKYTITMVFLSE